MTDTSDIERPRKRLIVASNRGPVQFRVGDDGSLIARRGGGGLVTALGGLAGLHDVTWVAHAMGDGDVEAARRAGDTTLREHSRSGDAYELRLVGELDGDYDLYYHHVANPLLWFVQHRLYAFGTEPTIDRRSHRAWMSYQRVNRRIAQAVIDEQQRAEAGGDERSPVVMVHDYHLFLVPGIVRQASSETYLQFFLHIPWPDPGAWRAIPRPWIREIAESLLACDIVGMQTSRDVENFLRTVHHYLGASVEFRTGTVRYMGNVTRVRNYPISVAVDEFEQHVTSPTVQRLRERIAAMRPTTDDGDGKLIVRVDRTDPSKNIVRGFAAYSLLLHEHPELHGRVSMFSQLDPSRQDIPAYATYKEQILAAANEINHAYATSTWTPLHINLDSNFQAAVAAYCEYDVLYVNPVADGMNLVSKEGPLVNERNGVVVLSDQAGSFNELGPYVESINPFDISQQADALYRALMRDELERIADAQQLRAQVVEWDVAKWIHDQLDDMIALSQGEALAVR